MPATYSMPPLVNNAGAAGIAVAETSIFLREIDASVRHEYIALFIICVAFFAADIGGGVTAIDCDGAYLASRRDI